MNYRLVFALLIFCFTNLVSKAGNLVNLSSPDKKLRAKITIEAGQLMYSLTTKEGILLVEPSALGIKFGAQEFGTEVKDLILAKSRDINYSYPQRGKHLTAKDISREYLIKITEKGISFHLTVRFFNDGFAFRYNLDSFPSRLIKGELSSFTLPQKSQIWFFERKNDWKLKSYAGEWISADIDAMPKVSPTGPVQGKPLIAQLANGTYLTLTEAALYGYSGMRLRANGSRVFQVNFSENEFDVSGTEHTPWRVILVSRNLNELVNSDVVSHLNPAPDKKLFANMSYIKPGKSVWSWMTRDTSYMKPYRERQFIDLAAQLSFEYTLIDEGWEKVWADKWSQLKEITDYGKKKGVGVWVWKHSVELREKAKRIAFIDSVKRAGAVGLKVDFMNSEAKPLIDFEISLLKECAERQLMINYHGCQVPSGESRTFPNEMTREGIRGLELNPMAEGPIPAYHNAALPFTRFVVGHGDYTPGLFSNPGKTTWGQQFACMYLFDSSVMCLAENPEFIINHSNLKQIVRYLKDMPVTWDETLVLPGSDIGKIAALARRKGSTWYIAVINGESKSKTFNLKASFLSKGKKYKAECINDKAGLEKELKIKEIKGLSINSEAEFELSANGGFVLKLSLQNQ